MAIDSINYSAITPSFKGSYKRTEQGNPYYHTNSAMKIGGTLAGLSAIGTVINLAGNNFFQKALKNLPEAANKKLIKMDNKTAILASGLVGLAVHLGSAAFVDYKRNEKSKETAELVKKVGTKKAVMNSEEVALSNKGRAYYDSSVGAKYGAWCGLGAGLITGVLGYIQQNKALKHLDHKAPDVAKTAMKTGRIIGIATEIGVSALGGWLLGKWSDSIANKDARKHA